jgi:hypothetical protein
MAALAADGLLTRDATAKGMRFTLRGDRDIERRLHELIALEIRCCAFLDFELSRSDSRLVLDVTGAPEAHPIIAQFFAPAWRQRSG